MLEPQIARIRLIEKLMQKMWNVAMPGWGSEYHQSSSIIAKVLYAIANKSAIRIGSDVGDHVPHKFSGKLPYALIDELRKAEITLDDLEKVRARRDANADLMVSLVIKMLERGLRSVDLLEYHIKQVRNGKRSNYLNAYDVVAIAQAELIKLDFSGLLSTSRLQLIAVLLTHTDLTPQQIVSQAISLSDQGMDKLREKLLAQRELVLKDINYLKHYNISAVEVINDLQRIATDRGSYYAHWRDPMALIRKGLDYTLISYLAVNIAKSMGETYNVTKSLPDANATLAIAPPQAELNPALFYNIYRGLNSSYSGIEPQIFSPESPLGNQPAMILPDTILLALVLCNLAAQPIKKTLCFARFFTEKIFPTERVRVRAARPRV
jgi:hypothetical protein